jgi:WD40 repeat protein
VPPELVPVNPATSEKLPAKLDAAARVGPLAPVTALCFSPDGASLLAGGYGRVTVWDLPAGAASRRLEGVEGAVHDIRCSPDGRWIGVAGGKPALTGAVLLYDAKAPAKPVRTLGGHADAVYGFAWSPDSRRLATASLDKTVRIHDLEGADAPLVIREHSAFVYAVAFSPDGAFIASGGADRSVKLFDAKTGKAIRTLNGHSQDVLAVCVTQNGQWVLSTGLEPQVRWWNAATGSSGRSMGGHGRPVFEIRLSADGNTLMTVSEDQTVRLWSAATGAAVKSFNSGGDVLWSAALSPDGKRVAAGSASGFVRVWDVASGRLLALGYEAPAKATAPEYLLATPEGYVSVSPGVL